MRYECLSGWVFVVFVDYGVIVFRVKGNVRYEFSFRVRDKMIYVGVNIFCWLGDGLKLYFIDWEFSEIRIIDDVMWYGEIDVCDFVVKDVVYDEA